MISPATDVAGDPQSPVARCQPADGATYPDLPEDGGLRDLILSSNWDPGGSWAGHQSQARMPGNANPLHSLTFNKL